MADLQKLCFPKQSTLTKSDILGLAIAPNQHGGYHIGVLHAKKEEQTHVLHLAFHALLRNDPWQGEYAWVVPDLPKPRARAIAALCRRIWRKHQQGGLPYAFRYQMKFSEDGSLIGDGLGQTCATFVMAVFEAASLPLLDADRWEARDTDQAWQHDIIRWLRSWPRATDEHIQRLQAEIGAIRYRPQEVASAGLFELEALPLHFNTATRAGEQLASLLQENCDPIG